MNKPLLVFLIIIYPLIIDASDTGGADNPLSNSEIIAASSLFARPSTPKIGTIVQPSCALATGSVQISGLPNHGTWILIQTPGGVIATGTGTTTKIEGLITGTYTYTVTDASGSTSGSSDKVVINAQPTSPAIPLQTVDCSLGAGNAKVTVSSPVGSGLEYRLDAGSYRTSTSFTGVINGNHTITVRSSSGCTATGAVFSISCGCTNPPIVSLGSVSGSSCWTNAVTVKDNIFGGSATIVTVTENGSGSVIPTSVSVSPFSFTYTPATGDAGHTVMITVTTNNPSGAPCSPAVAVYALNVNTIPSAPAAGAITQPTCALATGSVVLTGLPASGTWILTRSQGGVTTTGTGTSTTISGLSPGTYTFTVTNSSLCTSVASGNVIINMPSSTPTAPLVGVTTQPTHTISTGSVVLSGLPASGTWKLTTTPGGVTLSGSGASTTVSGLVTGTYTFTITNSAGCISPASSVVVINAQPGAPVAPIPGTITPPTCSVSTGSVVLTGLPSPGTWILTRYPGTITSSGTGNSTTISGLTPDIYNYTVTNAGGYTSSVSANVVISAQPLTSPAPVIGTITQPTCSVSTGKVLLNGLPSTTIWTLTRTPDLAAISGTGISTTVSGLVPGVYNFILTNSAGCISIPSSNVVIEPQPAEAPKLIISNPAPVCPPATVNLSLAAITEGSSKGLTFTYWMNAVATIPYITPTTAGAGTYYISGTASSGCSDIKPVIVTVNQIEKANAGPDKVLENLYVTTLEAQVPGINSKGSWSVISGTADFFDSSYARTSVSKLSVGENKFLWTITNGVCPPSFDSVSVIVHDMIIPTLITPNQDGKNDYFILGVKVPPLKTELEIFDRRGFRVYINDNYDNRWSGEDYQGNPLPDDTYFFVIKTDNGRELSGYIVLRR